MNSDGDKEVVRAVIVCGLWGGGSRRYFLTSAGDPNSIVPVESVERKNIEERPRSVTLIVSLSRTELIIFGYRNGIRSCLLAVGVIERGINRIFLRREMPKSTIIE